MASSSEGLATVEPWSFHQSFDIDSWLNPDLYSSHDNEDHLPPCTFFDSAAVSNLSPPQTLSNGSLCSDPDIAGDYVGGGRGGGAKRKPRSVSGGKRRRTRVSSKKSHTTFITADAANFRQMVQEVTGAKFVGSSHSVFSSPVVKPEPHRLPPTLDTSSFLSNHQQDNLITDFGSVSAPATTTRNPTADAGGGSAVELDSYPTLESWKVM